MFKGLFSGLCRQLL